MIRILINQYLITTEEHVEIVEGEDAIDYILRRSLRKPRDSNYCHTKSSRQQQSGGVKKIKSLPRKSVNFRVISK